MAVAGAVVAASVVVTAIALFTWANSYQPLDLSGGGPGAGVRLVAAKDPADFSRVALVHPGSFGYTYIIDNGGRWPVTIDGIEVVSAPGITARIGPWRSPYGFRYTAGEHPRARLTHHGEVQLNVRFHATCESMPPDTYVQAPVLAIHYRYLRVFSRTQVVVPSDVLTLACP